MNKILYTALLLFLTITGTERLSALENGTFKYKIKINGTVAGESFFTRTEDKHFRTIETKDIIKTQRKIFYSYTKVTETIDFKPVNIETIYKESDRDSNILEENTKTITFEGKKVTIHHKDGRKDKFNLKKKFYIYGDYFFHELKKRKFRPGSKLKLNIFDDDSNSSKPVIYEVVGNRKISLNDRLVEVIHISQRANGNVKTEWLVTENGVPQRVILDYPEYTLEMELVK